MELTTVNDDSAVFHDHENRVEIDTLDPDTPYEIHGVEFRTLPRPGELLCRFATVNDVHFGELTCGVIAGTDIGPTFSVQEGDDRPSWPRVGGLRRLSRSDLIRSSIERKCLWDRP